MRHALIVGINKYKRISGLSGCVHDARAMVELATYYNYDNIITLTDAAATKANITEALSELIDTAKGKDHVMYYHSGHGTQILDYNDDELDGFDEVLCNYDFSNSNAFKDDDLAAVIKPLKNSCTLHVMIDVCNSGTLTDIEGQKEASRQRGRWRAKTHPMPGVWQELLRDNTAPKKATRRFGIKPSWKDGAQRHTLLSACKANELSWEYSNSGKWRGLMTKSFEVETQKKWKNRNLTWKTAHKRTAARALRENKRQHARLEGPNDLKNKRIFGGAGGDWKPDKKR